MDGPWNDFAAPAAPQQDAAGPWTDYAAKNAEPDLTKSDAAEVGVKSFMKEAPSAIGQALEGLNRIMRPVTFMPPDVDAASIKRAQDLAETETGTRPANTTPPEKSAENLNPPLEQSGLYKAGEGLKNLGNQVPLTPEEEAQHPIAAGVGKGVANIGTAILASMAAGPEAGAGYFGLSAGENEMERAKAMGKEGPDATRTATAVGALNAALGSIDVTAVLKPVEQAAPGALSWAAAKLTQAARAGVTFAGVGEAQEYLSQQFRKEYDPNAQYQFDPDRLIASLVTGGALGPLHPVGQPAEAATKSPFEGMWEGAGGQQPPAQVAGELPKPTQQPPAAQLPAPREVPGEFVADQQGNVRPLMETEKFNTSPSDVMAQDPKSGAIRPMTNDELAQRNLRMTAMQESGNTPDVQRAADQRFNPVADDAEKGLEQIGQGKAQEPRALPPPQRGSEMIADPSGGIRPSTQGEDFQNQQQRTAAQNMGLTPDVQAAIAKRQLIGDAANQTEMNPTEAQKAAGNYKKGSFSFQGLPVTIENRAGSMRSGVGEDGKPWEAQMPVHYGYIKKTEGADGDHVDAFIGPNPDAQNAYVVDQTKPDGSFDEHKVLLGFDSPAQAVEAYNGSFSDGKGQQRIGGLASMPVPDLKNWLKGDTTKPLQPDVGSEEAPPETGSSVVEGSEKRDLPDMLAQGQGKKKSGEFVSTRQDLEDFLGKRGPMDVPTAIRDWLTRKGAQTNNEYLVVHDPVRNIVISAGTTNEHDNVGWDDATGAAFRDQKNALMVHHNHTEHLPISKIDLAGLGFPGIHTIVAHTNKGGFSSISLKPLMADAMRADRATAIGQLQNLHRAAWGAVEKVLQQAIKRGQINQQVRDQIVTDLTNKALDKAGVIDYQTTHHLYDNLMQGRPELVIDAAIAEGAKSAHVLATNFGLVKEDANNVATGNARSVAAGRPDDAGLRPQGHEKLSPAAGLAEAYRRVGSADRTVRARGQAGTTGGTELERVQGRSGEIAAALPDSFDNLGQVNPKNFLQRAIQKMEDVIGDKLKGTVAEKFAEGYVNVLQPELVSKKSLRTDALLAKYKVAIQNARDVAMKIMQGHIRAWDKVPEKDQKAWIKAYETGQNKSDPYSVIHKSLMDSTHRMERAAMGGDPAEYYRENYFPHMFEDPDKVQAYFRSPAMVAKYGPDWFMKARAFDLVEQAEAAGFKLKTYNPAEMDQLRLMAGQDMIQRMNLLKSMEANGLAERHATNGPLRASGRRIIGPDSKAWYLHPEVMAIWHNAMDARGLWQNETAVGSVYRGWMSLRSLMIPLKLGLSLFHPAHVATIHAATGLAAAGEHMAQGGDKMQGLIGGLKMALLGGLGRTNPLRGRMTDPFRGPGMGDHPAIQALNTLPSKRTPIQQDIVKTMLEGGFTPKMSEKESINFQRNWNKALDQGKYWKLLWPAAQRATHAISAPFFEHWIPGLKAEAYLFRARMALQRDPTLATDDGRRGEVLRGIAKDTERTYGEMNYDTLFWNKTARDAFMGSFLSAGWKLAQVYYYKGLAAPFKLAYKGLKGNATKADVTYNMLFAHTYHLLGLMAGGIMATLLGGQINSLYDLYYPPSSEKNDDGSPIRYTLPFFNKEYFQLQHQINIKGLLGGSAAFFGEQTTDLGVTDMLRNQDYLGRTWISDFSNPREVATMAWDTVRPISFANYEKADTRGTTTGKVLGAMGVNIAPGYATQSKFEQKVLASFDRVHGPSYTAYQAKLRSEYKAAANNSDTDKMGDLREEMLKTGMSPKQVGALSKHYKEPFSKYAFKELPADEQARIFPYAEGDERQAFMPLLKPQAREYMHDHGNE